jgi:hypothetical protein
MHHFMGEDLAGSLLAICLLPLFLWIPGYSVAWLLDLFDFRRRTTAFRIALSLPLSIAVCPIATYLLGRFVSMTAVWGFYAAAAVVFLAVHRRHPRRIGLPAGSAVFVGISAVWLGIALLYLADMQWGERLYYPTNTYDYALRASLTHAIGSTGIPPQSPLFLPGHPVTLRYHYFWLMMCSLANHIAPRWIGARQAEIAGTYWCGLGTMALVAISLRLLLVKPGADLRRRTLIGILLLGITGLDILPGVFLLLQYALGMMSFVLPSLECWNEYVDWFLHSVVWAPHAAAALIAGFTGFLLLSQAATGSGRRSIIIYGALGGMAVASTAGISIWVAFVFGIFLTVWTLVCGWKRWHRETVALIVAGFVALAMAWPYLRDLQAASTAALGSGGAGGHLVAFTVRAFSFAGLVPGWHGMGKWTRLILINGSLLPVNYFLEFGFFFLIARIKWRQYRAAGRPLARNDLACVVLLATSTLICTFLKSTVIGNNDLGWRGFLPAEFVLLLWSVDVWMERDRCEFISPQFKRLLLLFICLGAAGSVYEIGITRLFPILADRGVWPPLAWMSPDRQFGERNYAQREAYEWARAATAENAVIQYNPPIAAEDSAAMLYADRRTVAADNTCITAFGGDSESCKPIVDRLRQLYPSRGNPVSTSVEDVCRSLPIDILVAQDTDAVWDDRESWVWREKPLFANRYVRLFGCASRKPGGQGGEP